MSEEFKVEIVNPEKSFLIKEDVSEVVVPAFEGEMGILKDHISIISFLKPGIIKILSKSGDENYYVEDGIVEYRDNHSNTVHHMSEDVSAFLMWTAEPKMMARKTMGLVAVLLLSLLAVLLYFTNKKLWAPIKRKETKS